MFKFLTVALSCTTFALVSGSLASADDASAIQAQVSANLASRGFSQPGVFYRFDATVDLPYAYVQSLLGTEGFGGMSFVLLKTSGTWKVLGSGGGEMAPPILAGYGVPMSASKALQGIGCVPASRQKQVGAKSVRLSFFQSSKVLKQLAVVHGPSVLRKRRVVVRFEGRPRSVTLIQPLSGRICLL